MVLKSQARCPEAHRAIRAWVHFWVCVSAYKATKDPLHPSAF